MELFIALGAGLISFLSTCVLPLIPGYISYISGSSINELIEKKNVNLLPIIYSWFFNSFYFLWCSIHTTWTSSFTKFL